MLFFAQIWAKEKLPASVPEPIIVSESVFITNLEHQVNLSLELKPNCFSYECRRVAYLFALKKHKACTECVEVGHFFKK